MWTRRLLLALTCALLATSCTKRGASSAPVAPVTSPPAASAEAPPPTLTPVEEPDEVLMRARVERPSAIFDALVVEWGESYDWRARANGEGAEALQLLDLDAPIDALIVVDPDSQRELPLLGVFSIGVRSMDQALAQLEEDGPVRRMPDGVFREQADGDDPDEVVCELGPSRDAAAGRIVCGFGGEVALERLGPYMRRGQFDALGVPSSLAMSIDVDPLRRRFRSDFNEAMQGAQIAGSMGVAGIQDAGLREAASVTLRAIFDELDHLFEDLGVLGFEAKVGGPTGGGQVSTFMRMTGKRSYVARTLLGGEDLMGPAPAAFWALPISVMSAGFSHAELGEDERAIGRVLRELLLGAAREFGYPTKKLTQALDLYAAVATAYGDSGVLRASFPAPDPDPKWPDELRTFVDAFDVAVASTPRVPGDDKLVKAWIDVYNDRAMQKKLAELAPGGKGLPKVSWKSVPAKAGLPRGSYEMRLQIPKAWFEDTPAIKSLPDFSYIMVPTPDRLVSAMSFDRAASIEALRSVLNPKGSTLAGDPQAQRFRDAKVSNGVWMSMSGESFGRAFKDALPDASATTERDRKARAAFDAWSQKWGAGTIPAATEWSVVEDLTWRTDWRVEREAVRAGLDLTRDIYRAVEGEGGAESKALSPDAVPAAASKKRYAPKGGK